MARWAAAAALAFLAIFAGAGDRERLKDFIDPERQRPGPPPPPLVPPDSKAPGRESPGAAPADFTPAPEPLFELKDGNRFRGRLLLDSAQVETEFGRLTVTRSRLVRIAFGLGSDPDFARRIDALIEALGDSDFEAREKAQDALLEIGLPARSAAEQAANHPDPEVRSRAEAILQVLRSLPGEAPEREDRVVTTSFPLVGTVLLGSFRVETAYGALEIPRKALLSIDFGGANPASDFNVQPRPLPNERFRNTGILIQPRQRLVVRATGTVQLANWGRNASPDGLPKESCGVWQGDIPHGALAGRIGSKGTPFRIGSAFEGEAPNAGFLYLGVAGNLTPSDTGTFQATVEVGPKGGTAGAARPAETHHPGEIVRPPDNRSVIEFRRPVELVRPDESPRAVEVVGPPEVKSEEPKKKGGGKKKKKKKGASPPPPAPAE